MEAKAQEAIDCEICGRECPMHWTTLCAGCGKVLCIACAGGDIPDYCSSECYHEAREQAAREIAEAARE